MAKVTLGNHSAIVLPRAEQDRIRRFYRDVLGCEIIRETDQKDDFRMGDSFYIGVLYEDEGVPLDAGSFSKAIYLELKAHNVEEMRREILAAGVTVLEMQDTPTCTSRPPEDRSSGWSEPARTSPSMRGPTTASCQELSVR